MANIEVIFYKEKFGFLLNLLIKSFIEKNYAVHAIRIQNE